MFKKVDEKGQIIGFCTSVPLEEAGIVDGEMTFTPETGWLEVEQNEESAVQDFILNGPKKTEKQLKAEARAWYRENTDGAIIEKIREAVKAGKIQGVDLSEEEAKIAEYKRGRNAK